MTETQLIEERLRGFLSAPNDSDWEDVLRRAATFPAESSSGGSLIAAPRHRRWSRRLALGGVGALAAVAAATAAILVVLAGTGAPKAFAGWTASPTQPATGQTATALARCTARVSAGDWQPVVTDTRGPFTAMILKSAENTATCLTGPSFTRSAVNGTPGGATATQGGGSHVVHTLTPSDHPLRTNTGPISLPAVQALTTNDGQPYTLMQGTAETGVTSVTLLLSDGSHVDATVADGSLIAWWPGTAGAVSAQVTSGSSVTTQRLMVGTPSEQKAPPSTNASG